MKTFFALLTFLTAGGAMAHGYNCLLNEPEFALISGEFQLIRIDGGQAADCVYSAPKLMHCQVSDRHEYTVDFEASVLEKLDARNGKVVYSAEMSCLY